MSIYLICGVEIKRTCEKHRPSAPRRSGKTYLEETDLLSALPEAPPAHHEAVLADETVVVSAAAAVEEMERIRNQHMRGEEGVLCAA